MDELRKEVRKEAIVGVISWNSPGRPEINYGNLHSKQTKFRPSSEEMT
jgi:hypothetical protein